MGWKAPVLAMLMTAPRPRCFMPGRATRASSVRATTFNSTSAAMRSGGRSVKSPIDPKPALLTRVWISREARSAASTARAPRLVRSQGQVSTWI